MIRRLPSCRNALQNQDNNYVSCRTCDNLARIGNDTLIQHLFIHAIFRAFPRKDTILNTSHIVFSTLAQLYDNMRPFCDDPPQSTDSLRLSHPWADLTLWFTLFFRHHTHAGFSLLCLGKGRLASKFHLSFFFLLPVMPHKSMFTYFVAGIMSQLVSFIFPVSHV